MVILHYAGIGRNQSSGVSVIVPQILGSQTSFAKIALYNYGKECFDLNPDVVAISDTHINDDYHHFPGPFRCPNLVVFHSPLGILKCIRVINMLKKDNIPYVIVPHGCFSKEAMNKKKLKKVIAKMLFIDRMIESSAGIQYLSMGEKNNSIYLQKGFVVPNGAEVTLLKEKKDNKTVIVSFIGRKDVHCKGLDLLIEACGIAKERIKTKINIYIYGPCEKKENEIKELIKKNEVGEFVFDCPAVYGKSKRLVYEQTDILVLTSRHEGQPISILEAWSNGVPTLLTPGTNMAEECCEKMCGWKVDANVNSIASMLEYLSNNKDDIEKCSKNAYEYLINTYSWDIVAKKYYVQYKRIISHD